MKDLEIRGAGNLLGAQQHGHIAAVGFDLYCRLVEETIGELRGEAPAEKLESRVVSDLDAYLTDEYVESGTEKITFYKRLADTREVAQVDTLTAELADRFGKPPEAAMNLLALRRLKLMAGTVGIAQVDVSRKRVKLDFAATPSKAQIQSFMARTHRKVEFGAGTPFSMTVRDVGGDPLAVAREVLEALQGGAGESDAPPAPEAGARSSRTQAPAGARP